MIDGVETEYESGAVIYAHEFEKNYSVESISVRDSKDVVTLAEWKQANINWIGEEAGKGALFNKRVFCSDMTFDATVNPVVYEGGIPVFIDTEYDTWNMDSVALEKVFEIYPRRSCSPDGKPLDVGMDIFHRGLLPSDNKMTQEQ